MTGPAHPVGRPPAHGWRAHARAALVTAILLPALAALWHWLSPPGCNQRGPTELYMWTCLFPGLVLVVAPGVAAVLPTLAWLSRRLGRRRRPGLLTLTALTGLATCLVLMPVYLAFLGLAYLEDFLREVVFLPQPFVAGALSGLVHVSVLNGLPFGDARNRPTRPAA